MVPVQRDHPMSSPASAQHAPVTTHLEVTPLMVREPLPCDVSANAASSSHFVSQCRINVGSNVLTGPFG